MGSTTQTIIVAIIGLAAVAYVVKRIRGAMKGQGSCGCG